MARVDPLGCGNCGGQTFTLRHIKKSGDGRFGGGPVQGSIRVTCTGCKGVSIISLQPPTLDVTGNLCGGWTSLPRGRGTRPSAKKSGGQDGP